MYSQGFADSPAGTVTLWDCHGLSVSASGPNREGHTERLENPRRLQELSCPVAPLSGVPCGRSISGRKQRLKG